MNKRDKAIIDDITKFRALSRDQIMKLHFSKLKKPVSTCNLVLKRLQDRNYIKACKDFRPYVYVSADSKIKENSQKIFHFIKIADIYIELKKYDSNISHVLVEPRVGEKGTIEPDLFCIFKNTPFFIEAQRSIYNDKVMNDKIARYEQFYHSKAWRRFEWQKEGKEVFPIIILVSDTRYHIESELRILQFPDISSLMNRYNTSNAESSRSKEMKKITPEVTSQNGKIKIVVK